MLLFANQFVVAKLHPLIADVQLSSQLAAVKHPYVDATQLLVALLRSRLAAA